MIGGRVVARITGSVVRRFNSDGHLWACSRFPGREQLSTVTPEGVVVVDERWRDYSQLAAMERTIPTAGDAGADEDGHAEEPEPESDAGYRYDQEGR